ncbi:GTP-binding protein Era [Dethiosulfatibacter aminovorans DSM 17477]|uniref:GTPase Era n=1 Tax=Dethiosulfatibacter aminovorans DSM 17477 TaxID=1121476 RepID=A0A1M6DTK9_9FIRM|nr:GTPase Era [Dethiosulfatibacter aminovorans]SHI76358.1 GTP-binding protein Era [Dethiosulfatibacter aminovorans DSM 17477]
MSEFKSGFVTVVGRPNVGKSTLINYMVGEKVMIMSDKPQTTRNKIRAVYTDKEAQIVFIDTPGIHKGRSKLSDFMQSEIDGALEEMDVLIFITDEKNKLGPGDKYIIEKVREMAIPKIALVNKSDLYKENEAVEEEIRDMNVFSDVIRISATTGKNIGRIVSFIKENLNEGPQYFPEDYMTDRPEWFVISELIREKALLTLEDEVPHGVGVMIEKIEERKNKNMIDVYAVILCERKSHKGIIIGKGGSKLSSIGKKARIDIERLLGTKVYLNLWVKVNKDWRDNEKMLKELGYKSW